MAWGFELGRRDFSTNQYVCVFRNLLQIPSIWTIDHRVVGCLALLRYSETKPRAKASILFSRAPKADYLLNPVGALPNKFSDISDSLLILQSDSLK